MFLTKYIAYIADCEGIDYIEPIDLRDSSDVVFTDEDQPGVIEALRSAGIEVLTA